MIDERRPRRFELPTVGCFARDRPKMRGIALSSTFLLVRNRIRKCNCILLS